MVQGPPNTPSEGTTDKDQSHAPTCSGDHPWPYRALAMWFWHGIGPLATAIMGYLPGRALRFGEDVPAPAYWQWRRWCTSRDFHAADLGKGLPRPQWSAARPPVRLLAFEDDDLIPPHCVEKLAEAFNDLASRVPAPVHHTALEDCTDDPLGPAGPLLALCDLPAEVIAAIKPARIASL